MKRLGGWLALLVVLASVGAGIKYHYVQQGVWRERGRVADSLLVLARAESARLDTVYRTDTIRLWREVRRTDTLTQTVAEWKHDTIRVVEYVQQASETIRACTAALGTCEARISAQEAISAQWRAKYEAERAARPGFFGVWVPRVGMLGLGYLAGKAGVP